MGRKARLHKPATLYHVICGDGERNIFEDDEDIQHYLNLLFECVEQFGGDLYAFHLLKTKIHLVIKAGAGKTSLAIIMQSIHSRYSHNKKPGKPFLKKRYVANICNEKFLCEIITRIHRQKLTEIKTSNFLPGMYKRADKLGLPTGVNKYNYLFSSCKFYMNPGKKTLAKNPIFLNTEKILEQFNDNTEKYKRYIEAYPDRNFLSKFYLVQKPFSPQASTKKDIGNVFEKIITEVSEKFKIDSSLIKGSSRNREGSKGRFRCSYLAQSVFGISNKEIANYFHQSPANICKGISSLFKLKIKDEKDINELIKALQKNQELKTNLRNIESRLRQFKTAERNSPAL